MPNQGRRSPALCSPRLLLSQCDAGGALRFWRAWWIVLDGFGLTLAALVVPFGGADLFVKLSPVAVKDVLV